MEMKMSRPREHFIGFASGSRVPTAFIVVMNRLISVIKNKTREPIRLII